MSQRRRIAGALLKMNLRRLSARAHQSASRLFSPKRLVATLVAGLFLCIYLANGMLVILTRKPVDPESLKLWLSGSMAIYAMFHFIRASWQEPDTRLGLSDAENLWLARAPMRNRSLVYYRFATVMPSTFLKAILLSVVLACDVNSPLRLFIGLSLAMLLLEAFRIVADRFTSSLSRHALVAMRTATTVMALSVVGQWIALAITYASGSAHPLMLLTAISKASGEVAASGAIQWLAMPWWSMTDFAIAPALSLVIACNGLVAVATVVLSLFVVVFVDHWSVLHAAWVEGGKRNQWLRGIIHDSHHLRGMVASRKRLLTWMPRVQGMGPLVSRQWVAVRRYQGTILLSLAVPAALSLAPLVTSADAGLLHVAAWLAVCTLLLAPPALRIDFRRDLDRMWLLKSLPISPLAMTIGQILLPSLITIFFQLVVIVVACVLVPTQGTTTAIVVGGLTGLAISSFAIENILFLTFPHRPKQEGLAMMVRTKLVFLGKGLLLSVIALAFVAWVTLCARVGLPWLVLVSGVVLASWTCAGISVALTARCWRRFAPVSL
jgi:hypothetical protein